MAENNTLGEFSDGEDDWVWDIKQNNTLGEWSDGEDDWVWDADSDLSEWSDPQADDIIRNMAVDDGDLSEWSDPEADDVIRDIQTGRGEKRKSDEALIPEKKLLRNGECEKTPF